MLYNIVDRIYIGHIPDVGDVALTGVGVCMPLIMIVTAFAAFSGFGGAPRASIFMGKGDNDSAEKTLGNCFVVQILISVALTAVLLVWNRDFLMAFGASENTIQYGVDYMNIYAIGTIFVQLTLGMNAFITAQGFAKNRHVVGTHRRGGQHHTGPDFYLRLWSGCEGRRARDGSFAGGFVHLGAAVPVRQKDGSENPQRQPSAQGENPFSQPCARLVYLYYAGQ